MGYVLKILCLLLLILDDGFLAASEYNNSPDDALELFVQIRSTRIAPVQNDDMCLSDISDNSGEQRTSSGDELDKLVAHINKKQKLDAGKKEPYVRPPAPMPSLSISSRYSKLQGVQELLIKLAMRDITGSKTTRRQAIRVPNNRK